MRIAPAAPTQIQIPLCQTESIPESSSDAVFQQISDEFSKKYLQALNVTPTVHNVQVVKKNLPLSTLVGAGINATWGQGAVADAMTIKLHPQECEVSSVKTKKYGRKYLNVELPGLSNAKDTEQRADDSAKNKDKHALFNPITEFEKFSKYEWPSTQDAARIVDAVEEQRQKRIQMVATNQAAKHNNYLAQLETLKWKFIFPFCAEILKRDSSSNTILPPTDRVRGCEPESVRVRQILLDNSPLSIDISKQWMIDIVQSPFDVSLEKISNAMAEFVDADLPLELLARRKTEDGPMLARLRKLLVSKETTEMAGLCAYCLYWQCFGHAMESLSQESNEAVYCTITERWSALEQSLKRGADGLFFLSSIVLTLKWVVEWAFRKRYPTLMDEIGEEFVYKINLFFLRAFDRDFAVYSHFGHLVSSFHAMKLQHAIKQKPNGFKASNIVQMLMNGGCSHSTRALLSKSSNSAVPRELVLQGSKSALSQIALRRHKTNAKHV